MHLPHAHHTTTTDDGREMGMQFVRNSFPEIVARYEQCHKVISDNFGGMKPMYGLFYNFCLNGARPEPHKAKRVYCEPHVDWKNIAIGVCLLFVYGEYIIPFTIHQTYLPMSGIFDHKRKAWLVIWEANIMIEIPAGVFVAYPSSLFYHFNWDVDIGVYLQPTCMFSTHKEYRCCND